MLENIKIRNDMIEKVNKERIAEGHKPLPKCGVNGCPHFVDATGGMGVDTSCPYHRLLFDWWGMELGNCSKHFKTRRGRRSAFTQWANKTGKKRCDKIVHNMSEEGINWIC